MPRRAASSCDSRTARVGHVLSDVGTDRACCRWTGATRWSPARRVASAARSPSRWPRAGARVTLVARGEAALREVAAAIGDARVGGGLCDLTDAMAVATMVGRAAPPPGAVPDVLVNNAGLFPLASLDVMDPVAFERTVQANLVAPFYVLRAFCRT